MKLPSFCPKCGAAPGYVGLPNGPGPFTGNPVYYPALGEGERDYLMFYCESCHYGHKSETWEQQHLAKVLAEAK